MRRGLALTALILALAGPAAANDEPSPPEPGSTKAKSTPAAAGSAPRIVAPDSRLVLLLVRTTLLTLNDALRSDNFTVLRDLASPAFRARHTPGRLALAFAGLARQGVDLSAVAVLSPELSEPPAVDVGAGRLRLKGYFPGTPVRIGFDLRFTAEAGRWLLLGIGLQPERVEARAAVAAPASLGSEKRRPATTH